MLKYRTVNQGLEMTSFVKKELNVEWAQLFQTAIVGPIHT